MTNGTDKDIGKLLALAESHGKSLITIFEKLDKLMETGTTVCRENKEEIKSVKLRVTDVAKQANKLDKRLVAVVAVVIVIAQLAGVHVPKLLGMMF